MRAAFCRTADNNVASAPGVGPIASARAVIDELGERLGISRAQFDGAPVGVDRLGQAAEFAQRIAHVQIGFRIIGLELHGRPQGIERLLRAALVEQERAEIVVAFGIIGP